MAGAVRGMSQRTRSSIYYKELSRRCTRRLRPVVCCTFHPSSTHPIFSVLVRLSATPSNFFVKTNLPVSCTRSIFYAEPSPYLQWNEEFAKTRGEGVLPADLGHRLQHRPNQGKHRGHSQHDQRQGKKRRVPARAESGLRGVGWVVPDEMMAADRVLLSALERGFVVGTLEAGKGGGHRITRDGIKHVQLCVVIVVMAGGQGHHFAAQH